jgi:hypothetical protein
MLLAFHAGTLFGVTLNGKTMPVLMGSNVQKLLHWLPFRI